MIKSDKGKLQLSGSSDLIMRRSNMLRRILRCDICGDTWDITETDLNNMLYPGAEYIYKRVREGVRRFNIQTIEVKSDDRMYRDDMDICDKCYNKLDKFIYDLSNGGGADDN